MRTKLKWQWSILHDDFQEPTTEILTIAKTLIGHKKYKETCIVFDKGHFPRVSTAIVTY